MSLVEGIGGIFFRARDPDALKAWYLEHLGVPSVDFWPQPAGNLVFAPFRESTDYWPEDRQWMLNLRVSDLDALTAKLEANGITVETKPEWEEPEFGRFARITDPEGNPIELWEPAAS